MSLRVCRAGGGLVARLMHVDPLNFCREFIDVFYRCVYDVIYLKFALGHNLVKKKKRLRVLQRIKSAGVIEDANCYKNGGLKGTFPKAIFFTDTKSILMEIHGDVLWNTSVELEKYTFFF